MRKSLIIILLAVFILFSLNVKLNAYFFANEGDRAYKGGGKYDEKGDTKTIREYTIEGAAYFLQSHSDFLLFLKKIELSELNGLEYPELQDIINSTIENIEKAKDAYINLISVAKATPYNGEVIEKLLLFDYTGFQREKGLNNVIFSKVAEFLSKGDVTGLYIQLKLDIESILEQLSNIQTSVDNEKFPEISNLWLINQKCSELILFGQYSSEVFFMV
jgi:hypothetical protein